MDEAMTETIVENRLAEYDVEIAAQFATGAAREHSYRPALQWLLADAIHGATVGTNAAPQAGVSVSVPRVMFQNDDDNCDGIVDYEVVNFGNILTNAEDDVAKGGVVCQQGLTPVTPDGDWWGKPVLLTATIGGEEVRHWVTFYDPYA